MAFLSTRTGRQHIFVMNDDGSAPRILSPYGARVEFHAPDWNPLNSRVVFHGAAGGPYQIMVADADRGQGSQIVQLTSAATNEDPSWAPDGRHIVYTGSGADTDGLYVIDTVTGTIRLLVRGARLRTADWSPSLAALVNSAR